MRRIRRGSSFRLAARVARRAVAAVLSAALLLGTPGWPPLNRAAAATRCLR
ncbi:hypothetical protein I552_5773 [Mycobacterium xenopi 3993]|nr:hypothetical protein I552_5773 [Mycobacterium xenopi 3993]